MTKLPKAIISAAKYARIRSEAEAVAVTIKTDGWKIIENDLLQRASAIEELLVQNRLRTVQETITQNNSTKTFTTMAETQIAENSGAYKLIQEVFSGIQLILEAPDRIAKLEAQGRVVVGKTSHIPEIEVTEPTFRVPKSLQKAQSAIRRILRRTT